MSRTFPIVAAPYLGPLFSQPINLGVKELATPTMIAAVIPWANYATLATTANVGVFCNMELQANVNKLNRIQSVFIDNTDNDQPVYVQFQDTGFTASCAPNSVIWQPVITKLLAANIYCEGFTGAESPTTTVFFLNISTNPFTNSELPAVIQLWKASAAIAKGGNIFNTNYGTPALCDQNTGTDLAFNPNGETANIPFPVVTGYIYLNVLQGSAVTGGGGGQGESCTIQLRNITANAVLWTFDWCNYPVTYEKLFPIVTGLNLKILASDTIGITYFGGPSIAGQFAIRIGFTTNPT